MLFTWKVPFGGAFGERDKETMEYGQDRVVSRGVSQADVDAGLRAHMLRVYNYMMLGLGLTGAMAFAVNSVPAVSQLFYNANNGFYQLTVLGWIAAIAPLAMVFFLSFRIDKMSFATAQTTFWVYAAMVGLSLAPIFAVYTGSSVARVFFITAGAFGALSLYGYTTKRDLSAMGKFLFIGLVGLIIAMVVNIFLASSAMHFAISIIGVLIFAGLTAYDTQKIKEMYMATDSSEIAGKKAVMGALRLYLDFLNMFLFLLQLFGARE